MKIVVTGSLGNISKPLTIELIQKGHSVTVISSNDKKRAEIESLGAIAAIGSLQDVEFVTATFTGADAIYSMVPPGNYFDPSFDLLSYYRSIGQNYKDAIKNTGVKRVVNLSTIGGHLEAGNGILVGAHNVERILNTLAADVSITHIRPTEFYYNLLSQIYSAKNNGFIASNIGGDVINSWVSPIDIANVITEELTTKLDGRNVRYVASEELTYNELVKVLGKAIGNNDLKWVQLTNEQMENGLLSVGMNPKIAAGLTEMYAAINSGLLYEDYINNKPSRFGTVKLKDFVVNFAKAYNEI